MIKEVVNIPTCLFQNGDVLLNVAKELTPKKSADVTMSTGKTTTVASAPTVVTIPPVSATSDTSHGHLNGVAKPAPATLVGKTGKPPVAAPPSAQGNAAAERVQTYINNLEVDGARNVR